MARSLYCVYAVSHTGEHPVISSVDNKAAIWSTAECVQLSPSRRVRSTNNCLAGKVMYHILLNSYMNELVPLLLAGISFCIGAK